MLRHCPPIVFLLTGFSWLLLASILGLAILIGLVHGTPLPPWVRQIHVHAALVGGIQGIRYVAQNQKQLSRRQGARSQHFFERAALNQFHRKKTLALAFARFQNWNDPGV